VTREEATERALDLARHGITLLPGEAFKVARAYDQLQEQKDAAYEERNRVVAWAARMAMALGYRAVVTTTAIEGWDPNWHHCLYIETPAGQVSWHLHTSQLPLVADIPRGDAAWDGHTTDEKYKRLHQAHYQRTDGVHPEDRE